MRRKETRNPHDFEVANPRAGHRENVSSVCAVDTGRLATYLSWDGRKPLGLSDLGLLVTKIDVSNYLPTWLW